MEKSIKILEDLSSDCIQEITQYEGKMKKVLYDTGINELLVFDLDNLSFEDENFLEQYHAFVNYSSKCIRCETVWDLNDILRDNYIEITHNNIDKFYEHMDEENKKKYEKFLVK